MRARMPMDEITCMRDKLGMKHGNILIMYNSFGLYQTYTYLNIHIYINPSIYIYIYKYEYKYIYI